MPFAREVSRLESEVKDGERQLDASRGRVREYEDRRDRLQSEVNRLHREHVDRRAEHDAAEARKADTARRLNQLETGLADVRAELDRTEAELACGPCAHGNGDQCAGGARAATRRARTGA